MNRDGSIYVSAGSGSRDLGVACPVDCICFLEAGEKFINLSPYGTGIPRIAENSVLSVEACKDPACFASVLAPGKSVYGINPKSTP